MINCLRPLSLLHVLCCALVGSLLTACEPRDELITRDPGARLSTSAELDSVTQRPTIRFDTVFTQRGSVSKRLWVYNHASKAVHVDEIALVGAENGPTPYALTIDGRPGPARRDFDLRGKDSLLVLVKVTIDPTNADTVFLVQDSIRLSANGGTSYVRLRALGENAQYYDVGGDSAVLVDCNTTWTPQRPIVLLNTAVVDSTCTLTIEPGTRVYVGPGASLVVRGRLLAGRIGQPAVRFLGLRREYFTPQGSNQYADAPGQWGAIVFVPTLGGLTTAENVLENCDIRNPTIGVQISNPYFREGHRVRLENTFIRNCYTAGVLGVGAGVGAGGGVTLRNVAIANVGQYAVAGLGGGTFRLTYCTLAVRSPSFIRRDDEALAFNDVVEIGAQARGAPIRLTVENSIVWSGLRADAGGLRNEILILHQGGVRDSSLTFRNSVLQTTSSRFNTDGTTYNERGASGTNVLNQNPKLKFESSGAGLKNPLDLQLDTLSPASGLALLVSSTSIDLRGAFRLSPPDAGAYERENP